MDNKKEGFRYTYSAKQQEEIEKIRSKYMPREESKMERLRALDASVTHKASVAALVIGIIGALVLGIGMCCVLVWEDKWFVSGIGIGLFGILMLSSAYPLYQRVIKKERKKIAPEILRLSEELLK